MRNTALKIALMLVLSFTNAYAGWYKCYNYNGTIGQYPITLSIQVTPGYFGEKAKKDYNINGVYKYDSHNTPIKLEGTIDFKNNKAYLYEIQNGQNTAVFEFDFSENSSNGNWTDIATKKTLPLHLDFVSKLIDSPQEAFDNLEILQADSLPDYYFVGTYTKPNKQDDTSMTKLKIIRKKDDTVFQVLEFSTIGTETGNVRTVIYDNVEVADAKTKQLSVWNNAGRMGGILTVNYNLKTKRFKVNPKPIIEGPQ